MCKLLPRINTPLLRLPNTHCFHMHHGTSLGVQKLTRKQDIFYIEMCEIQTKSLFFTLHWGNSLVNTWQECARRHVRGLFTTIMRMPQHLFANQFSQAATDPTLHWPVNMQLASDWIINRMCYPQNSHGWAQSLRSNLRGSELPRMSTVPEIKPQRIKHI